jgi:small-conductance mechanosensitive channel
MSFSLEAVLYFIIVIWITMTLSRIVRSLLQEDVLPRAAMSRGRSHMVSMVVNYFIIGLGLLAALAAAGIRVEQFALIGGALGVGIGFGLQTVVSNFVSGLILVFERPIQVGDTVEVGNLIGSVRRIGVRSSTIRTFDEAEVIVPNNDLITGRVINWTLSDRLRRMEMKVGVAYGTDPKRVQELLKATAAAHEKVLSYPEPYVLFEGFGESSLDFALRFWTSDYANWIFIASDVKVACDAALKEAGIRNTKS